MDGETRKAEFQGSLGEQLSAALELPRGVPIAYALFAHCFSCSKDIKAAREIARALRRQGFAVLRFDFTGLGASEGDFSNTNFSSNVGDLVQAADFLRREFEAPKVLIGHSLGGAAVVAAAASVPEVRGVVTIGAPAEAAHVAHNIAEHRDEIEQKGQATVNLAGRPFTIRKQFLEDLENQTVLHAAGALAKPLLILHAPLDQTVGIENAAALFGAAKHPKSFISLDTADHLLSRTEDAHYAAQVIAAWSRRYVGAPLAEEADGAAPDSAGSSVDLRTALPEAPRSGSAATLVPGRAFAVAANLDGHGMIIDAGTEDGGDGLGPNPTRVVEGALAACGVMTMRMYANRKRWDLQDATITVARAPEADAHAAMTLEKTFHFVGDLDADQKARLIEMADKCPVHRMLEGVVTIRHK